LAWRVAPRVCTTGPRSGHVYYVLCLACSVNECDLTGNILVIRYRTVGNKNNISNSVHMTKINRTTRFYCPRFLSTFTSTLSLLFRTTPNSNRLDSLSVCLGWICCCSPLPPLCTRGPGHHSSCRRGRRRPTPSAQRPSRADLTRRLSVLEGFFVVPRYPVSAPVDVKFAVVVTQTVLHNSQTSSLHNPGCVICRHLHSVRVHLLMYIASR
jgi:hypothetical protein